MRMRFLRVLAAGMACVSATAGAQVLRGSVVMENTEQKVPNALVTVFDSAGKAISNARADRDGEFLLRLPPSTRITVQVVKVGYSPYYIQNLPLGRGDTINVVVPLAVVAQRIAATVIEAERMRIRQQRILGLDARAISATVITPSEVSLAAKGASSYLDIVRSAAPGGVVVDNTRNCVISLHVSSIRPRCLPVFIDEQLVSDLDAIAQLAQPELVDHFVFLRGTDAAIKFGNDAIEGVMLIYTRRSEMIRSRPPRP
jgi:hypothetical protein